MSDMAMSLCGSFEVLSYIIWGPVIYSLHVSESRSVETTIPLQTLPSGLSIRQKPSQPPYSHWLALECSFLLPLSVSSSLALLFQSVCPDLHHVTSPDGVKAKALRPEVVLWTTHNTRPRLFHCSLSLCACLPVWPACLWPRELL